MPMTEKQLTEYLLLYGARADEWPVSLRGELLQAQRDPALALIVARQQQLDEALRLRRFTAPSQDLSARIIEATYRAARPARITPAAWLQALLASIFPQPAMALTAMLTLGVAIGFGLPAVMTTSGGDAGFAQAYNEDDGATL